MNLSPFIDHTILKPDCSLAEVKKCCDEALQYQFAAVCVPPFFVKDAVAKLEKSNVRVASVAGFPMGYANTPAKVEGIKRAIDEGADEMDVVINLCAVKSKNWNYVKGEVETLTTACHMKGKTLKLILETGLLTEEEILKMCKISSDAEVDYVKTSTGFNGPGASVGIVRFLRENLPADIKIKAAGGIRDRRFAEELISSGADRLGSSAGVAIVTNLKLP